MGSEPPYDGAAIIGAVYDANDVLEIVLGDPGAEEADVAKIFIGGVALDITSSDVTFTADATTDPSSPVPAKVTVTGLVLTSDTVITYDADGDISYN